MIISKYHIQNVPQKAKLAVILKITLHISYLLIGLEVNDVEKEWAKISWNKYTNLDKSEFNGYIVRITEDKGKSPTIKHVHDGNSKPIYKITNLVKATLYKIEVCVKSKNFGQSKYSEPLTIFTRAEGQADMTALQKLTDYVTVSILSNKVLFKTRFCSLTVFFPQTLYLNL